jgi:hypothetical protein
VLAFGHVALDDLLEAGLQEEPAGKAVDRRREARDRRAASRPPGRRMRIASASARSRSLRSVRW